MNLLLNSTYGIWLIILLIILFIGFIYLLSRNGWKLKNIKRIKIGPIEGTRFDKLSDKEKTVRPTLQEIDVDVRDNKFHGDSGDIGGIIIKNNVGDNKK